VVVIDARMVGERLHGIARYVTLLIEGLRRLRSSADVSSADVSSAGSGQERSLSYEPVLLVAPGMESSPLFAGFRTSTEATPFLAPSEQWRIPNSLRALGAALYHSPSFASLLWCPCPAVQTVHDLNHLRFGGWKERLYYGRVLRPFARRARALLTVSEASRAELSPWVGRTDVEVVYNAVEPRLGGKPSPAVIGLQERLLARHGLDRGAFFLSLSNQKPHKNLPLLVAAHARYRAQGGRWPLVLSVPDTHAGPGVLALGGLAEDEAEALLRSAGALVFPSLYEGFGLPPVEAAAVGTRVVLSDIAAHREALAPVADHGDPLWVPALDREGWVKALARVEAEAAARLQERTRKSAEGAVQTLSERYSVLRLGAAMDRVYRRCLELGTK
jgi:glycosyltransferase involved in cell wall biosynthesis